MQRVYLQYPTPHVFRVCRRELTVAPPRSRCVADGAPVGVLYDTGSGQSQQLAELLVRSDPNVHTEPANNCDIQLNKLRESGIRRFVSLCEKTPELGDDILVTLDDACRPGQPGCHSLRLPAGSQQQALATLVRQLQLSRVLLADQDAGLAAVLAGQGVRTVDVTPEALQAGLEHRLSDPAGSVAVVQSRAALLPALRSLDSADVRAEHWFVPGVTAEPLTKDERQLLGDAHLYTMQTGTVPGARLPQLPEGSSTASVALALDAVAAARGDDTGFTGPLEFDADRKRVDSFVEVLLHRPSEGAALVPRAGEWVPVALLKGAELLPPSVQYVLPSVLMPQLSGGADCRQGRLSLAGTDAVVGRRFRSEFAVGDAPHLLLVYGSAPFLLSLECTNVTSDLHCGAEGPGTCVHLQHTYLPAAAAAAAADSPAVLSRVRRSATAHFVRGGAARHAPMRRRYRSGRAGYTSSANQVSENTVTPVRSGQFLAGVNRAGGYEAEPSPAAPTAVHPQHHQQQQQQASHVYDVQHSGAPYARQDAADAYQAYTSLQQQPAAQQTGLVPAPPRNGYSSEPALTKREVLRVALSDIFGCFGSMAGCGLCMQYFATYSDTQPETCYAACALGISGNCIGAIGNILSQLLAA